MATITDLAMQMLRGEAPPPSIARLFGFTLKSIEPGRAVFEMEVDDRHDNPMGTLHGGVYCDLADAAMGFVYAATLGEGESFTTVELKINFLRAVRKGKLVADAKVVKAGSTLGYVECEVTDEAGKLLRFAVGRDCRSERHNRVERVERHGLLAHPCRCFRDCRIQPDHVNAYQYRNRHHDSWRERPRENAYLAHAAVRGG